MATGGGLALPEHLQDEDASSWFKRFEVCAAANSWDDAKKLLRLPTLLKGRAWAIFDSLGEDSIYMLTNYVTRWLVLRQLFAINTKAIF